MGLRYRPGRGSISPSPTTEPSSYPELQIYSGGNEHAPPGDPSSQSIADGSTKANFEFDLVGEMSKAVRVATKRGGAQHQYGRVIDDTEFHAT